MPRHLETSFMADSDPGQNREVESPSKQAAARRAQVIATPTASVSERSRFSLALASSSSSLSQHINPHQAQC